MKIEYNKNQLLGSGAYGTKVFEGFLLLSPHTNRMPVAVKRLELMREREDVNCSKKEEEALRNLKHPNVVKLYHVESDSDFRYFALELCETSLDKLFLKDGDPKKCCRRMPPREEVLYQLAEGLKYIHKMGMTHRDIKPQNVLIWMNPQKEEEVLMKWADFGLSKRINENGSFSISGVRGTDNWLAPELLKLLKEEELTDGLEGSTSSSRRRGTIQSDVFAEGLVFGYFYLDGEHIFGKIHVNIHSQTDINNNISKNNPVNISKIQPTHVHDLILKMLSSAPDKRITSSEVVEYLTQYRAPAKRNVLPGSMLEINYEKIIGKEGYGILYEGVWETTRLPVAVKQMQLVHVLGKKQEESWLGLSHDNVVKLFHAENDSKFRYYALELCQASLDQIFLNDQNPKKYRGPKPQTEEGLYQLALGLEYIHEKKLIHCALKPKNVLLWTGNSSTVMKWTNFGSSKEIDAKGTCPINEIKGGLDWLAPEILKALENEENQSENPATLLWECCTFKSDVFAEGLVFGYLLLGGLHPYGSISRNIQTNINQDKPANITSKIQSSSIRELTLKMLTYKPESRLTSSDVVKEFRDIWNSQQKEMEKTLFNLCTEPNPSLIKIKNLVNQGISVNCLNEYEITPLLQFLANGEAYRHDDFVEIIRYFVEKKINLNAKNEYGENALLKLIVNYKKDDLIDLIKLFVDNEIDINCKNKYGTNILHYVCKYYSHENLIDIIQLLIEQKVEINCNHDIGYNALPVLCRNYNHENLQDVIELLIENGIENHCNRSNDGSNAVQILCKNYKKDNLMDIVALLSKGDKRKENPQNGSSSRATKRKRN